MSGHWLQSHSGSAIDLIDVHDNDYAWEDIAIQLDRQPRFSGATSRPYSVLEHTLTGYHLHFEDFGPSKEGLAWLLHDAAEAFLGDLATPLKALCPGYQEVEQRFARSIFEHFGADFSLYKGGLVGWADQQMLILERAALMVEAPRSWGDFADWEDYSRSTARKLRGGAICATGVETFRLCLEREMY